MNIYTTSSVRNLLPKDFKVGDWAGLEPYYAQLLNTTISSKEELETFLVSASEIDGVVQEDLAWRYIRMTCNTQEQTYVESYQYFVQEILPHLSIVEDQLNKKISAAPGFDKLPAKPYINFVRGLQRDIELFREDNVPLQSQTQSVAQEYSATIGAMTIEHQGKTLTLQQAARLLERRDRTLRKKIWNAIWERRLQDKEKLHEIFDSLLALRTQIAQNAGYSGYTDYKFAELKRFDYTRKDTLAFHNAVEKVVKPLYIRFMQERKELLQLSQLRPWDTEVDIFSPKPLKPFKKGKELIDKTCKALKKLKPELGGMLQLMQDKGFLDVDSRIGKAPGGYNYPLMETGIPFIFMNATGSHDDVVTLLHESGHAIHSFVTNALPINALKHPPSEVAELASMSMELIALDAYEIFYPEEETRKRAMKEQILRSLMVLPWIATVDAFQQWLYDHPQHSRTERSENWTALYRRFHGDIMDWKGYEENLSHVWQKQLHIFEVPFYYIEYAIAQLGAIAVWRNYKRNPEKGLSQYLAALQLGYTHTIPEIYATAGIKFDFSEAYIQEQMDFCLEVYDGL